jgi:agmatinase
LTTNRTAPTFAPSAIPFLASSIEPAALGQPIAAAIFGAPLDLTESFRSGAQAGPAVVRQLSDALETYSPVLDRDLEDISLLDLGDVPLDGVDMVEAQRRIADAAEHAARMARRSVMLGGEHTASYGGFRGVQRVHPELALVQLDAHLDIRASYAGQALTHASWVYQLGIELGFARVFQLGMRSGERAEWRFARAHTSLSSAELALPTNVRAELQHRPVYLSVDIDVLDPAHAPGTGCPEPGGVTSRELLQFVDGLGELRIVGLDVMEVSPKQDPAAITAVAAAKLVREVILLGASY